MTSEIRVNKIENRSGLGTVTFADTGVDLAGIVTATTFSGSGASLTALPAAQLSGTLPAISAANLTNVPAANITGTLPAISAANLTNVPAANVTGTLPAISGANLTNLTAANLTGALPAISAASCTSIPAANIVGLATAGFNRSGGFGGGGRTISSSTTLNSTSFDYTGFSADTTRFDVIFRSVQTGSVDWGIRIGDSGGIEVSSYVCRSGYNRSSDNVAELNTGGFFSHGLAGTYTTSGFFSFYSLTNNQHRWQCHARLTENGTGDHIFVLDGYRHLDSALTSIRIMPESGSFTAGEVHLVTYND